MAPVINKTNTAITKNKTKPKTDIHIPMKTSDMLSIERSVPSLFQIAAFFEDFFPSSGLRQSLTPKRHLPFADYMNPEKILAMLRTAKSETPAQMESAVKSDKSDVSAKRGTKMQAKKSAAPSPNKGSEPSGPENPKDSDRVDKSTARSDSASARGGNTAAASANKPVESNSQERKKVEFSFKSSTARSVKLAGDFTDWESHALDMRHKEDGSWFATVPLAPGSYSYRFIVDGQWVDDPMSNLHMPNPFGTENAVVHVT